MTLEGRLNGVTMAPHDTEEWDRRHSLAEEIEELVSSNDGVIIKLAVINVETFLSQSIYSGIPNELKGDAADQAIQYFREYISAVRAGGDAFSLLNEFLDKLEDEIAWEIYDRGVEMGRTDKVGPSAKSKSNRATNWGTTVETPCARVGKYLRRLSVAMLDQEASKDQRRAKLWEALTTPIVSIFRKVEPIKRPSDIRIVRLLVKPLDSWTREDTRDFANWIGLWTCSHLKAPDGKALTAKAIEAVGLDRSAFDAVNRLAKAKCAGSGLGQKTTTGGLNLYGGKTVSNASSLIPTLDAPTTTAAAAPTCPTLVGSTTTAATDQGDPVNIGLPGGLQHPPFNPAAVEPTTTTPAREKTRTTTTTTIESPQPEAGPAPGRLSTAAGSKPRSAKRRWRPDPPPGIDASPPDIDVPPINGVTAALLHGADVDVVDDIAFYSYKEPPPRKMRLIAGANVDPKNRDSWVATAAGLPTGQPRGTAI